MTVPDESVPDPPVSHPSVPYPSGPGSPPAPALSPWTVGLFALACGVIVGNLYYSQPIITLIAPDIGLGMHSASLIVSLTQIGYMLGLLFLVPLGDLVENRRLILGLILASLVCLAVAAVSHNGAIFLLISLLIGITTVSVQTLIPLAAHLAPDATRGRVVGNVMGGLVTGILLSRPLASLIAGHFGWRAVFATSAIFMLVMAILLFFVLPRRLPDHSTSYLKLMRSMGGLWLHHPALRQRTVLQACMFCTFSLFWTAAPLELIQRFHLSQNGIALFALAGATGALAAPLGGRLADAGHTDRATLGVLCGGALVLAWSIFPLGRGVIALALVGVVLDFCVQMNAVLGQRTIYGLDPASRGRLNGVYMSGIFIGGAIGSALASPLYSHGGWTWVAIAGAAAPLLGLAMFILNRKRG